MKYKKIEDNIINMQEVKVMHKTQSNDVEKLIDTLAEIINRVINNGHKVHEDIEENNN